MWLDGRDISEHELQAYVDRQRQLARNAGCEAMTNVLKPMILKASEEAEQYKKEIANLKRQVSRLKNKYENLPVNSCRDGYPPFGHRVLAYFPERKAWKIVRWMEHHWTTGSVQFDKKEVSHWMETDCVVIPPPKKGVR